MEDHQVPAEVILLLEDLQELIVVILMEDHRIQEEALLMADPLQAQEVAAQLEDHLQAVVVLLEEALEAVVDLQEVVPLVAEEVDDITKSTYYLGAFFKTLDETSTIILPNHLATINF